MSSKRTVSIAKGKWIDVRYLVDSIRISLAKKDGKVTGYRFLIPKDVREVFSEKGDRIRMLVSPDFTKVLLVPSKTGVRMTKILSIPLKVAKLSGLTKIASDPSIKSITVKAELKDDGLLIYLDNIVSVTRESEDEGDDENEE